MSVYRRTDSKDGVYSYDFELQGRRFSGSTGRTTKREAEQVEKAKRAEAKATIEVEKAFSDPNMTVSIATSRYWEEVGQHHANWENTEWSMGWLVSHFGQDFPLQSIDDEKVTAMVAKRRGESVPSQRLPGRKYKTPEVRRRVSNATVNRTVTQPLREILLRASSLWGAKTAKVDWSKHLLDEPKERVREASAGEEAAIMAELARGYDVAVEFAFLNGCRRMEILGLEWSRVDFFGRRFTVIGKGNKARVIPMTKRTFEILWAQQNFHAEKVFTYVAARTVKLGNRSLIKGNRYPLTEAGLKIAMRRAVPKSGVKNFRFHDTRHTAATRVLRKSNLKVVQQLLGHEDVKTTTKYAHAMVEDVLDALEAASPTETPTEASAADIKGLKDLGKAG
ncbi:site-specific integrase [Mesorhizobium sp. M1A.F.Ca.IN.022.05.2.1]|uniref:tyrosine-type recombinase/integrase n=2 Tax=Mesorhizobium TaxID=68287 RepID=UPI000FCA122D|nr:MULTISPECIES: site-specific integrase [unclassified Mesorhizobium]RUV84313.1 site-specific integrase [Mesorhizobium sp. M1A.F.Ca.IN.020.32.1.1]RUW13850.1 site-specific integrase [Mesorhizobium sp. M1A.F.Ca.IN.022.05.2.1]RWF81313.1 MAG: site-specific integrase [Mesorhizobium sp.]RWG06193.1 MAG: site-specific integrase [Mesorhizobium sp.]RWG92101.1 MAG: site-specific integrase [Mesorhizobium sp.]